MAKLQYDAVIPGPTDDIKKFFRCEVCHSYLQQQIYSRNLDKMVCLQCFNANLPPKGGDPHHKEYVAALRKHMGLR